MAEMEYHNAGNSEAQEKEALSRLFAQSGVLAAPGVLGGLVVSQNTTADGNVLITAGSCVLHPSMTAGASLLMNDTTKTLNIFTANPVGGLPRNDIIVFDSVTAAITVIVGTPNATPTDPTVPNTSLALARLRHAASATTIPTAKIDQLQVSTFLRGVIQPPATYTSVGGAAPLATVGNTAGTVLQTLVVPAVAYARVLSVDMLTYVSSTQTADAWEAVGTWDSNNVAVNVLGRFRMTLNGASSAGSGSFNGLVAQPANTAKTLRVWVRRVGGTGTATGSTDETFCNINVVALPT